MLRQGRSMDANMLKIVLVNTVCGQGSVGRITADLYETARRHDAQAAVAYGRGNAAEGIVSYKIGNRADFYRHVCRNFFLGESGFGSAASTRRFLRYLEEVKPDILHLHNLHGFYLQTELLFAFIKEKHIPVVWTFHDCWPFTGHCAYYEKNGCLLWQEGCMRCRYHRSAYPYALFRDNAKTAFQRKKEAFTGVENLVIVTPSRWLAGEVKKSFLKEYPVEVIPNGIDLSVFAPKERQKEPVHTVLGVANIWEERKGLSFFVRLAETLPEHYRIRLIGLSAGQQRALKKRFGPERLMAQQRTESLAELAEAYRQADVFVNPTLEDNFPTANLEALACGTPVVTFETGGSPETIGVTKGQSDCGICVEKGNADALLQAVRFICEGSHRDGSVRTDSLQGRINVRPGEHFTPLQCRARAEQFEKNTQYDRYFALYQRMKGNREA